MTLEQVLKFDCDLVSGLPSPMDLEESSTILSQSDVLAVDPNGTQTRIGRWAKFNGKLFVSGLCELNLGTGASRIVSLHLDSGSAERIRQHGTTRD
jgi:hypothetical protein